MASGREGGDIGKGLGGETAWRATGGWESVGVAWRAAGGQEGGKYVCFVAGRRESGGAEGIRTEEWAIGRGIGNKAAWRAAGGREGRLDACIAVGWQGSGGREIGWERSDMTTGVTGHLAGFVGVSFLKSCCRVVRRLAPCFAVERREERGGGVYSICAWP